MTAAPLVSVLLPVYNAGPYLAAALGSILRQDYDRLEVIAIDDGSTDNSLEILERYRRADNRVSVISRENRGLVATLNEGLRLAQGELVARMDADDVAYPWRLSRQVAPSLDLSWRRWLSLERMSAFGARQTCQMARSFLSAST